MKTTIDCNEFEAVDFIVHKFAKFIIKTCIRDESISLRENAKYVKDKIKQNYPNCDDLSFIVSQKKQDSEYTSVICLIKTDHMYWKINIEKSPKLIIEYIN